jgi:hypothetical protein
MARRAAPQAHDPPADPFNEHRAPALQASFRVLGGRFDFATDSAQLLKIVAHAYHDLPAHVLRTPTPRFRMRLLLLAATSGTRSSPPAVRALSGAGLLGGAVGGSSFVAVDPSARSGLIVLSSRLLHFPYHVRYELIEFAAYTLATRTQALLPLHAACVGRRGRGVLLVGASGAGKSLTTLACGLQGLQLLSEDSVLLEPRTLRATGVANFLHLRRDCLRFLGPAPRRWLQAAPIIRRRSGVEKFELDLRHGLCTLAPGPLKLAAVVFLSAAGAHGDSLLQPLSRRTALARLAATQRYAAQQSQWPVFCRKLERVPAFELRRGGHPRESAEALGELV